MDKEIQRIAWSCLPKEFKEEVKKEYEHQISIDNEQAYWMLERIFGKRNLTSDAEGEDEMLTVKAKMVREMYAANDRLIADFQGTKIETDADVANNTLRNLFGSKCLPDELNEDNFAKSRSESQPKFHKGDKVKVITDCWKDKVYTVTDVREIYPQFSYKLSCSPDGWFAESTLELAKEPQPTEPKFKNGDLAVYLKKSTVRIIEYHPEQQKYYVHRSLDNLKFLADEYELEPIDSKFVKEM